MQKNRERGSDMDDEAIILLYNQRSERAIEETSRKYGGLCRSIAYDILQSNEDTEECVNDTYLSLWNSIPPEQPMSLSAYIGRITRNAAVDRIRHNRMKKRGGDQYEALIGELADCIPAVDGDITDNVAISLAINRFLGSLTPTARLIFMRRYWYMCSTRQIARELRLTETNVRVTLHRARKKFKKLLEEEGISI